MFGPLSVEDNLRLGAYRRGRAQAHETLKRVYALFPALAERRRQAAGTLSGGQQMLAIGRALMASRGCSCWMSRAWASRRAWWPRSSPSSAGCAPPTPRCCSSSRTPPPRSPSPTAAMCSDRPGGACRHGAELLADAACAAYLGL